MALLTFWGRRVMGALGTEIEFTELRLRKCPLWHYKEMMWHMSQSFLPFVCLCNPSILSQPTHLHRRQLLHCIMLSAAVMWTSMCTIFCKSTARKMQPPMNTALQYSTVRYGMVRYGTVQYYTVSTRRGNCCCHCRFSGGHVLSLSPRWTIPGALQRFFFQKSEITMEVGGWVQVSLRILLLLKIVPK